MVFYKIMDAHYSTTLTGTLRDFNIDILFITTTGPNFKKIFF